MGVIRGCEDALATPNGYITRTAYENMSFRTQSTFARSRPRIYSLFEAYLKRKQVLSCYDTPERYDSAYNFSWKWVTHPVPMTCRTHALLKSVERGVTGKLVDFLYVDEAQDNLLIDAGCTSEPFEHNTEVFA